MAFLKRNKNKFKLKLALMLSMVSVLTACSGLGDEVKSANNMGQNIFTSDKFEGDAGDYNFYANSEKVNVTSKTGTFEITGNVYLVKKEVDKVVYLAQTPSKKEIVLEVYNEMWKNEKGENTEHLKSSISIDGETSEGYADSRKILAI